MKAVGLDGRVAVESCVFVFSILLCSHTVSLGHNLAILLRGPGRKSSGSPGATFADTCILTYSPSGEVQENTRSSVNV